MVLQKLCMFVSEKKIFFYIALIIQIKVITLHLHIFDLKNLILKTFYYNTRYKIGFMKRIIFLFLLFPFSFHSFAGVFTVEGVYQGRNLYVQNPFAGTGIGFCTTEVLINGKKSTDEIQSSAFEIDFSSYNLKIGDKVEVRIKHKDDCKPKVLNPEVLKLSSTFEVIAFKAIDGIVNFTTKGESASMPFTVEQFRWNKWVKIGEVQGKGTVEANSYSVKVNNHSGINKFRIQQTDFKGPKYSNTVQYR